VVKKGGGDPRHTVHAGVPHPQRARADKHYGDTHPPESRCSARTAQRWNG
jgi:hypothetical protein